jgi:hypothetical protein
VENSGSKELGELGVGAVGWYHWSLLERRLAARGAPASGEGTGD